MADITAGLVKDAAREDRRRHDGLQEGARRKPAANRGGGGLAARKGPRQGGQEGRPGRRRGRGRGGDARSGAGMTGAVDRAQRRDRLRRPQRDVPGRRAQDRPGGAGRRRRRRGAARRARSTAARPSPERSPASSPPSARTWCCAASARCSVDQGAVGAYVHNGARRDRPRPHRRAGGRRRRRRPGGAEGARRARSRCMSRPRSAPLSLIGRGPRSGGGREGAGDLHRTGRRVRQAAARGREDGRGPHPQVL